MCNASDHALVFKIEFYALSMLPTSPSVCCRQVPQAAAGKSRIQCTLAQYVAPTSTFQVAAGAAALYVQQLQRIERFSPLGSQQLAADLEYFCNVLAALSVALPPELISWAQSREVRPHLLGKPRPMMP